MMLTSCRRLLLPGTLLLLGGCWYPFCRDPDAVACDLAARPLDVRPAHWGDGPAPAPAASPAAAPDKPRDPGKDENDKKGGKKDKDGTRGKDGPSLEPDAGLTRVLHQQPERDWDKDQAGELPRRDRLRVPAEVPGSERPPVAIPRLEPATKARRDQAIRAAFPDLPPLGDNPRPAPGPQGRPLELADLQRLAMSNNPRVKQAAADVEARRGQALQAGLYPNPRLAFQAGDVGQGRVPGAFGGYLGQRVVTAGKLKLARASAEMDVRLAELTLTSTRFDVMTQVRTNYFAALAAQETMAKELAFAQLAEEVYRIELEQLRAAQVAVYEPMQFRALAIAARARVVQTRNRTVAAWKQLAASLGLPGLPPTELAGRITMPIPDYPYEMLLARALTVNTDVQAAEVAVAAARYDLRLAQVTPIPDVDTTVIVQKDYTNTPFGTANVTAGVVSEVALPVWDRNQGRILQTEAQLLRATEEAHRVRNDLSGRVAEAYERYLTNRRTVEYFRANVLPDLVQVFRRVYERYQLEPEAVNFNDVSTSLLNLENSLNTYLAALGDQWRAVADLAGLVQTDDLFRVGQETVPPVCLPPLPPYPQLLPLRCHHPCSPPVDPAVRVADPDWSSSLPPLGPVPGSPSADAALPPDPADASDNPPGQGDPNPDGAARSTLSPAPPPRPLGITIRR